MNFDEYLKLKKINPETFLKSEPIVFRELEKYYGQIHPESFTTQKKFLINKFRNRYPIKS